MTLYAHGEQVQVIRPVPVLDEYSQEITRWSFDGAQPETLTERFAVAPRTSPEEPVKGRSPVYSGFTLYGPVGHGISHRDRVIVRGETYEVDGEIADWISPHTGHAFGSVVNLTRSEG